MSIRVGLVDDDARARRNLARWIDARPGFACVVACGCVQEALKAFSDACPDVVLMDIHLPGASGIAGVARLRRLLPRAQVIMLTVEDQSERVFQSLQAGASGYLVKPVSLEQILEAVAEVHRGGAPMSSHIARMVVTSFRRGVSLPANLSPREEEVLGLLAAGYRSKEIGEALQIGVGTVNTYVRHIYEKLHVRSRAEAVARFVAGECVRQPPCQPILRS